MLGVFFWKLEDPYSAFFKGKYCDLRPNLEIVRKSRILPSHIGHAAYWPRRVILSLAPKECQI
jgi:hypothetical protein